MANFRVYYVERTVRGPRGGLARVLGAGDEEARVPQGDETEWEEDVEAENVRDALRLFFQDHLGSSGDLGYIDEEGRTQRPFRIDDFDLNRTYVWTEGDKFMEYQGIEQIDAGPKGAVIAFRNKSFANPEGLIAFIREEGKRVKLQPDHRLIYYGNWQTPEERLAGARELLKRLVKIAGAVKRAA